MVRIIVCSALILFVAIFCAVSISQCVSASMEWNERVGYAWDMADKSSTLTEKSKYIDEYISRLKDVEHEEYGAIVYKIKSNRYDLNLKALETLGQRLKQVQKLDVNSFAYQTAIQQITAQEQGEAQNMIKVFYNAFILKKYWWAFSTVQAWVWVIFTIVFLVCGTIILFKAMDF